MEAPRPPRSETPHPAVATLITGRFREGPNYATWRSRGTTNYLLILTVAGYGRFGHAGGDLQAGPGDAVLLKPGTRHDYGTAARPPRSWELLWVHFLPRPHWEAWLNWPEAAPGLRHLALGTETATRTRVEDALTAMHRYATGGLARRDDFALNALEAALLWCDAANPQTAAGDAHLDPRIRRARTLLRERLGEPVPVPELARAVALSPSRLAHLFKEQTGQTPQQFVEQERIARAQQLLAFTSRSVAAIAEEVGFASPFYFAARFKKHTGLTPRDWRRDEAARRSATGAPGFPPTSRH